MFWNGNTAIEGLSGRARAGCGGSARAPAAVADSGLSSFLYQSDEPEALARQRLDQTLFLAGIADRASSDIQAGREGRIGHNTPVPNGIDEVVLADDVLPVADQIVEQVEDLWRDGNGFRAAMQLAPVRVERIILEHITQVAIPLGGLGRGSSTA